jgi:hypothetical protein
MGRVFSTLAQRNSQKNYFAKPNVSDLKIITVSLNVKLNGSTDNGDQRFQGIKRFFRFITAKEKQSFQQ